MLCPCIARTLCRIQSGHLPWTIGGTHTACATQVRGGGGFLGGFGTLPGQVPEVPPPLILLSGICRSFRVVSFLNNSIHTNALALRDSGVPSVDIVLRCASFGVFFCFFYRNPAAYLFFLGQSVSLAFVCVGNPRILCTRAIVEEYIPYSASDLLGYILWCVAARFVPLLMSTCEV